MLSDVAAVVAAPVPAFELGIVSELFGLRRMDPELPSYRYAVCAETHAAMPTRMTGRSLVCSGSGSGRRGVFGMAKP